MLLKSQILSQPLVKRWILSFFHQNFLSRDAYDRVLGRDVINGRSKPTSQRQFASIRRRAQKQNCFVIASSTVEESLSPFDRNKAIYTQSSDRAVSFAFFVDKTASKWL